MCESKCVYIHIYIYIYICMCVCVLYESRDRTSAFSLKQNQRLETMLTVIRRHISFHVLSSYHLTKLLVHLICRQYFNLNNLFIYYVIKTTGRNKKGVSYLVLLPEKSLFKHLIRPAHCLSCKTDITNNEI